jgi:TadE-like protein
MGAHGVAPVPGNDIDIHATPPAAPSSDSHAATGAAPWPTRRHRVRGQSVVEFVLIFPVFLIILAGAVDLGRLFYAFVAVENAAKEGAFFGARNPLCDDDSNPRCSDPGNVVWRVEHEATNLASGGVSDLIPTISCLSSSDGTPRLPLKTCVDGDTYVVAVTYDFHLITPILGQLFGSGLTLGSEARATVLNDAFDPTPGLGVEKLVRYPDADCSSLSPAQSIPCFERSPRVDPANGNLVHPVFHSGDSVTYRVTIRNIGGTNLTSVTLGDTAFGGAWAPVSGQCPTKPTSLAVGASYTCTYSRTLIATKPSDFLTNTVTGDSQQTAPVQDVATVNVLADPPQLSLSKNVNVYLEGGSGSGPSFGNATSWTAFRNSQVSSLTMWFRITVSNTGGLPATGFALSDSSGSLPTNGDCPSRPSSLAAGASYTCRYSRPFNSTGNTTQTATANSSQTGAVQSATTVSVQACGSPSLVIPNLIGMKYNAARSAWQNAGFAPANFSPPSGNNNTIVGTQNRVAYECKAANTSITVTP